MTRLRGISSFDTLLSQRDSIKAQIENVADKLNRLHGVFIGSLYLICCSSKHFVGFSTASAGRVKELSCPHAENVVYWRNPTIDVRI
mgnify:CR=1 FL=1